MPRKRKISWDTIGIAIQIAVGVIEIGILIYQCISGSNNEEEENE